VLNREVDKLLGGSRVGCHKTDLIVRNTDKGLSAELCSSGEQKSLLISLVIAAATAFLEYSNKAPIILLDEVFTHLDFKKKSSLLEKLIELDSQIWITATEKEEFFQNKKNFCYHHLTKNGLNNVY
jgi:DNA replication and repair protein RecF